MTQQSNLPTEETFDHGGALSRFRRTSVFFLLIRVDRFVQFALPRRERRKITRGG